jgi:(1->4)-alpha-D-glucan 1-alpha-D-glucosylmutase
LTVPGIPDIYQGCELWDLSLVDPDNRRPVDYGVRMRMLQDMAERVERGESAKLASELLADWHDGRVKAYVTWRLLHLRKERAAAFLDGPYAALETTGTHAEHVVAFARDDIVVVVPRLVRRTIDRGGRTLRLAYEDERIRLRPGDAGTYIDRFTGATIASKTDGIGPYFDVPDVLGAFPVAVLERKK